MSAAEMSFAALIPAINSARTWTFEFDPQAPAETLTTSGSGLRVERTGGSVVEVWADHPNASTRLAALGSHEAQVFGSGGGIVPCYGRYSSGRMRFSNLACRLIARGERIRIKTYAVLQHLSGVPYPQDNIFADLTALEASGVYHVRKSELVYESTKLIPLADAKYENAMEVIHRQWQRLTSSGSPLCVLLSGGYDSRLNLALALHYARQFGNQVFAFHEHKNEQETTIAKAVANMAGVPLTVKTRHDFVQRERPVEVNRAFVQLHSGTYRENLLRWHHYFAHIRELHPDGILIGFGAEAHKGKFYGHVHRFPEDCERVFGADAAPVHQMARRLGIRRYDRDDQRRLFKELNAHAEIYAEPSSRIDFVHYQTYVANGYGKRCHSVWQLFGFAFPFLDEDFLRIVFSMPRADKEGFRIVTRAIQELNAQLLAVPLTSANEKALGEKKRSLRQDAALTLRNLLRPIYDSIAPAKPKGRTGLLDGERDILSCIEPGSEVTRCLYELARTNLARCPRARLDYAMQFLLYFHALEAELAVSLDWA